MPKFGVRTIVAIGIGTALFYLLGRFVSIPVFANTTITFQYAILGFFAAAFGPIAGLLIGFLGHMLIDLTTWGAWWSWIVASGVVGLLGGFVLKGVNIDEGEFGKKGILRFIIGTVIVHLIAWVGVAPVLDILIYAEPVNKVFTQGLVAAAGNIVTTAIIGTLLLFAYSKTRTKSGSLNKE